MTNITVRWAGPSTSVSTDGYRIERALVDLETWTTLDANQAATAPYASPSNTLASNTSFGDLSIALTDATDFSTSGFGWIDDALVEWADKIGDSLEDVTWHTGYGTYAALTAIVEAHESYVDSGVSITNNVAVYKITRIDTDGNESAPAFSWYFSPPVPASKDHCVVVVLLGSDVGMTVQVGEEVTCELSSDNQFGTNAGTHLDQNEGTENTQVTNDFGLAFFQCWKNIAREGQGGADDVPYTFTLKPGTGTSPRTVTVTTIPDLNWILLSQIADSGV